MSPISLPTLWKWISLNEICTVIRGVTFPSEVQVNQPSEKHIACLRTTNVQEQVDWDDLIYIPRSYIQRDNKLIRQNDILISIANSRELVGKVSFVDEVKVEATFGGFISVIRASEFVDAYYLYSFLRSNNTQEKLRSVSNQTVNIANLTTKEIENLSIPLPTLLEQRRLGAILHQVDMLRFWRQVANKKENLLLASIFQKLFGDPITAKSGWTERSLGDFLDVEASLVDPRKSELENLPKVGSDNIESNTGKLTGLQSAAERKIISGNFLFSEKNILYSKIRPALRKVATPDFIGLCSADIYPISFDSGQVTKFFLAQLLRSDHFTSYTTRVSGRAQIPKVNRTDLLKYRTLIPDLETQKEFEKITSAILEHQNYLDHSHDIFDRLLLSITSNAFSGELTTSWRERRKDELQRASVVRDKAFGLRGEKARLIDYKKERVTPEEMEELRKLLGNFAVNLTKSQEEKLGEIGRQFVEMNKSTTEALARMSENIIEPFLQNIRQTFQGIQLTLPEIHLPDEDEINRQLDELPLPQEKRAIHDVLDATSMRVLKLANVSPAYFTSDDLAFGEITTIQASASLRVLESLGFVRLVEIDGVLRYRLVDANDDYVSKSDQLIQ